MSFWAVALALLTTDADGNTTDPPAPGDDGQPADSASDEPDAATASGEPPPAYGELYTGASTGASVFAGPVFSGNDELVDSFGIALAARASVCMILQIVEVELGFSQSFLSATAQDQPIDISSSAFTGALNIHPLFLGILFAPPLGQVLASVYLQWGLSLESNHIEWANTQLDESWEVGDHFGIGIELPLDDPNDGQAFWLSARWRYSEVPSTSPVVRNADGELSNHTIFFGVSFRDNGLPF